MSVKPGDALLFLLLLLPLLLLCVCSLDCEEENMSHMLMASLNL